MIGTWELFHNWANIHYQLGLTGRQLTPGKIQDKMANDPRCAQALAVLQIAADAEWLFEVRTYRNYAHRPLIDMNGIHFERDGSFQTYLVPARDGQSLLPIGEQLSGYVAAMRDVGLQLDAVKRGSPSGDAT
jgi:hypothetical protein